MCSSLGLLTSKNGKEEILFVAARPRSPLGGSLKTTGRCIFSECQNKWISGLETNIDNNHSYVTEYESNVTLLVDLCCMCVCGGGGIVAKYFGCVKVNFLSEQKQCLCNYKRLNYNYSPFKGL